VDISAYARSEDCGKDFADELLEKSMATGGSTNVSAI
jgi:hypothetical protein